VPPPPSATRCHRLTGRGGCTQCSATTVSPRPHLIPRNEQGMVGKRTSCSLQPPSCDLSFQRGLRSSATVRCWHPFRRRGCSFPFLVRRVSPDAIYSLRAVTGRCLAVAGATCGGGFHLWAPRPHPGPRLFMTTLHRRGQPALPLSLPVRDRGRRRGFPFSRICPLRAALCDPFLGGRAEPVSGPGSLGPGPALRPLATKERCSCGRTNGKPKKPGARL
jgi:hypothetical protein